MSYFLFCSLAITLFIVAASPGPGVFITVSTSLSAGFYQALFVIAGIVTGHILFLELAIFGLSLAAKLLGNLFIWIKFIGGAYLVFLGIKILFSKPADKRTPNTQLVVSPFGNFLKGFFVTLGNPKALMFYCSIFPSFVGTSELNIIDLTIVILTVVSIFSLVLIIYSYAANRVIAILSKNPSGKMLNRTSGGIMILAGIAVILAPDY